MTGPLSRITQPSNFRDLAAHVKGVPVRRGTLYRSDHLGSLDTADAAQIQALGITRVLDFRGVDERTAAACRLPDVTVHSLAIEPTIVQKLNDLLAAGHALTATEVAAHMQDTYRGFVLHNTHRFAEFFGHLLASDEPTVFHCTAGKDRTGFAAALLLRALGTSESEVMHDYMLTNELLAFPEVSRHGLPRDVMAVLWRVQPEFLQAAYEEVDRSYGSLENYFRDGLQLHESERAQLKRVYLGRS